MKNFFLFLLFFAIILFIIIGSGSYTVECSIKRAYNSHLFSPIEIERLSGEIFLLSHIRCGIKNISKPPGDPSKLKGAWKKLRVNADKIEDVFLIVEPFEHFQMQLLRDFCTHNCLWFEFQQNFPAKAEDGYETYGLICSGQMTFKNEKQYFLFQFTSKEDYFKLAYCMSNNIYLYKLNLSEEQKKTLFYNAIASASERAAKEEYHVISNNCINNMLELLNTVLPFYQKFNHWLVYRIIFNPLFCSPAFNEYIFRVHFLIKEKLPAFKSSY